MAKAGDKLVEMYRKKYSLMSEEEKKEVIAKYSIEDASAMNEESIIIAIVERIRHTRKVTEAKNCKKKSNKVIDQDIVKAVLVKEI